MTIDVRVTPRAAKDELAGWQDGVLRVRLRAPPLDGRANQALCRLLAARLGLPPSAVAIVGGEKVRNKRVRLDGLGEAEVLQRLL